MHDIIEKTYVGVIKEIRFTKEYDDELKEYKEDYDSNNLWYKIEVNGVIMDILLPQNEFYNEFYVKDMVKLIERKITCSYEEYKVRLKKLVETYFSYLNSKGRDKKYLEMLQDENSYNKTGYFTEYDIDKL